MTHDPRHDPQPGDRLAYKGWMVTVVGREDDSVRYTRSLAGGAADGQRTQDIAVWRGWATLATVLEDGRECTVMLFGIAGPCTACGRTLGIEVHVAEGAGVRHPECCAARKHGKPRKAKENAA